MDEFAQTREPDNLFDDDFTPVAEPVTQLISPNAPRDPAASAERARQRGRRGRGRGRGQVPGSAMNNDLPHRARKPAPIRDSTNEKRTITGPTGDRAPTAAQAQAGQPLGEGASEELIAPAEPHSASLPAEAPTETADKPIDDANEAMDETAAAEDSPEKLRRKPTKPVEGDRTGTGGVAKPKLTEAELSERLEAARQNAARREAAHAAASADQAQFQAREDAALERQREQHAARRAKVAERRREEVTLQRAQDTERERNRERKMRGQREWDVGKNEEDFASRGGRRQRDDFDRGQGYGRGGDFYARGERGRGRGGRGGRGIINFGGDGAGPEPTSEVGLGEIEVGEDAFSKDAFSQTGAKDLRGGSRGRGRGRGRGMPNARGGKLDLGAEEFPALQIVAKPAGGAETKTTEGPAKTEQAAKPAPQRIDSLTSPVDKGTWADQMDASAAATG